MSDGRDQKDDFKWKLNFTDTLHVVQNIMKTSEARLSKEEIVAYFDGMGLSRQQKEMIYQYLQGTQEAEPGIEMPEEQEEEDETELPDTIFFRSYLEDLQQISQCTQEEEELLYERLAAGDESSVQKLVEQWMHKVLRIAKKQTKAADTKEFADIIQEGNMGVFLALQQMLGSGPRMDFEEELSKAARNAMEEYMQKTAADTDMDQSLVAKAALVYEAQEFLAEHQHRLPTAAELSQYTKLPETELEDILSILEKKKA